MGNLFQNRGTAPDNSLLADVDAVRVGLCVYPGEGELDRGTILVRDGATGMYKAAASGAMTGKMLAVLDESVDAGSSATGVGVTARAYERGTFIAEKVKLEAGAELAEADKVALAAMGIRLRVTAGTVDNEVT